MAIRPDAERFVELYAAIFHRFHRTDPVGAWQPSPEALALFEHLSATGPLTVREACEHFGRSQAATSELLARLEARGLIERAPDERDRRRTLVWMSDRGVEVWRESRQVLALDRVEAALRQLKGTRRRALIESLQALLQVPPKPRTDDGASPDDDPM